MKCKILYVDDEPVLCKAFERSLRGDGYQVVTMTNPLDALKLLQTESFDIVAADYKMPLLNGFDVLREVKVQTPSARRLLVTGMTETDSIPPDLAHAVLTKPWTIDTLRQVIASLVRP